MSPGQISFPEEACRGFSLVELLVGMLIGLIGIVIMFQVMENAENRKRTTAAGGDAQVAGSVALYTLERDVRLAGYGFAASTNLGCAVTSYDSARGGAIPNFLMVPVQIIDGAAGAPDQLIVFYGAGDGNPISYASDLSTVTSKRMASSSSRSGIRKGDLLLVASASGCGMVEVTDNTNSDQRTINHGTGTYSSSYPDPANVTNALSMTARFNSGAGYDNAGAQLFALGRRDLVRRNVWQISNAALAVVDSINLPDLNADGVNGDITEVGERIIDLQAQYGLPGGVWQASAPGNFSQVTAIRVALLARSQQYEKDNVTPAAPGWMGGDFSMRNVDGTADTNPGGPNDWRHYRYRVYETVIPLRNVSWGTAP